MSSKITSFLMAVTTAIIGLISVQIWAPVQFKPLTNHLLDYPGTLPSVRFDRGIYRVTSSATSSSLPLVDQVKKVILSYLPQTPTIAGISLSAKLLENKEQKAVSGYKAQVDANQAAKEAVYQQNLAVDKAAADLAAGIEPSPAQAYVPKTSTINTVAGGQTQVYIDLYGDCIGCYGYKYPDGTIAGKYELAGSTTENPVLHTIGVGSTIEAESVNNQYIANKVAGSTTADLLESVGSTCGDKDFTCQQSDIEKAIAQSLKNEIVFSGDLNQVIADQKQNAKINDYVSMSDEDINAKYGKPDGTGYSRYDLISTLSEADKTRIQTSRDNNLKLSRFLSPSTPINSVVSCPNGPCSSSEITSFLTGLGYTEAEAKGFIADRARNIEISNKTILYADASKSNLELAKTVCGDNFSCVDRFKREDLIREIDPASEYYKSVVAEFTKNAAKINYLNTPNSQLIAEKCGSSMSPDRCYALIQEGGILKDAGLTTEVASIITEKSANITLSQLTNNDLGTLAGKPIDLQAVYDQAFSACRLRSRGSSTGCNEAASEAVTNANLQHAPIDYQTAYDQAYQECQSGYRGGNDSGCATYAESTATSKTGKSKGGAINIPTIENQSLIASCISLGGSDCSSRNTSIDSVIELSSNPDLTIQQIEFKKQFNRQETLNYQKIVGTLKNLGQDVDKIALDVNLGNTTWQQVYDAVANQRQNLGTDLAIGWNDITIGRFKRGNDMLLEGYAENNWGKSLAGGLIQGGDAAFYSTLLVAAPLSAMPGVGFAGFLGTGMGIAATTQMTGTATDACTQSPGSQQCYSSVAMAAISGVGTFTGVANAMLAQAGRASAASTTFWNLTTAERVIKEVQLANSALGSITFTAMGIETCKADLTSLDCISGAAMALASYGTLGSSVGLLNQSNPALQELHAVSAKLFAVSACSKLFGEGGANADSVGMCAMGLSGVGNLALEAASAKAKSANAVANERMATPEELASLAALEAKAKSNTTATPEELRVNDAKNLISLLENRINKDGSTKELDSNLNLAKMELVAAEAAQKAVKTEAVTKSVTGTAVKETTQTGVEIQTKNIFTRISEALFGTKETLVLTGTKSGPEHVATNEELVATKNVLDAQTKVAGLEQSVKGTSGQTQKAAQEALSTAKAELATAEIALATAKKNAVIQLVDQSTTDAVIVTKTDGIFKRLADAILNRQATPPSGVELILEPLFNTPAEKAAFEANLAKVNEAKNNQERSILSGESSATVAKDPAQAKAEAGKTIADLAKNGQKAEIEKLATAHEKLVAARELARELTRLENIKESNRSVAEKARIKELQANAEVSNINKLVDEYNLALDSLRSTVLADRKNGLTRMNEIQEALQKVDILTEIRTLEQQISLEKSKGASADKNSITSWEKKILNLASAKEIIIPAELGLTKEVQQKITDIIRDTEHRLAIFEDGARSSRANQIDTLQKLLSNKFT
ncbi:MAG: hypothetical protein WCG44_03520, partial [bacterium]